MCTKIVYTVTLINAIIWYNVRAVFEHNRVTTVFEPIVI